MNLFDKLVNEALKNQSQLSPLRMVVEKELLHHDILKALSDANLLQNLTFIGGTCLRLCYGGVRLSEDLDFTGGIHFSRNSLSKMGEALIESIHNKYGLSVAISEPIKDVGNVQTWKIKIETRPQQKSTPAQRINIDICALPSYERIPMMLINPYGVDMGTRGLIIQAQSREEIYIDKLVAFALRPNRIKYRDIWDIVWLHNQGLSPRWELLSAKLRDRNLTLEDFFDRYNERLNSLTENRKIPLEFEKEMHRFLSEEQIKQTLKQETLWEFITYLLDDLGKNLRRSQG